MERTTNSRTKVCVAITSLIALLFIGFPGESHAASLYGIANLRLRPSHTPPNEGMLQVYHQKFWGYVCYDNWTNDDANVACRHLGYATAQDYHAMETNDILKRQYRRIFLHDVQCAGTEENIWDCDNARRDNFDEGCLSLHVVWLECTDDNSSSSTTEPTTIASTAVPQPPPVEVGRITYHSVSLDWRDWYAYLQRYFPEDRIVNYDVYYRPIGDPTVNFTLGTEIFGYFKSGTIENLQPRTTYEFRVESIRLDPDFAGESVGQVSSIVTATTPCKRPRPVEDLVVLSVLPRQVKVGWKTTDDEDCPPEDIFVEYKLLNREQCRDESGGRLAGTIRIHGNSSAVVDGLDPYSTYAINVSVVNRYGRSSEVPIIVNTTQSEPSGTPRSITTDYHSGENTGIRSGPKTLTATWDDPVCGETNGIINGYTYMLLDVKTDRVISSGSTEISIVHLPKIDPMNRYKFLVAARTSAGMGPYGAASVAWHYNIEDICGQSNQRLSTRIAGGAVSTKGEFPWMAQIWHIKYGTKFCAGSILDNHWIITAAHCIVRYNITQDDVRVQLGDYDTLLPEPQQRVYDVDTIHVNVGFNEELYDDDIALIHVREPIEFSDYIKPICLPDKKIARNLLRPGEHKYGIVAGWGKNRDGKLPRYLKQVSLPIVDRSECKKTTNYTFTPNMFCAGHRRAGGGDACEGDSGGPFMARRDNRYFITGLVSWGHPLGCDKSNSYGYYTRIFKYMSWIKKIHPTVSIVRH